jgi:hypothetical protein
MAGKEVADSDIQWLENQQDLKALESPIHPETSQVRISDTQSMAAAFLPSHLLPDETACSGTLILHSQNMR